MAWRICVIRDHFVWVLFLLSRYQNSRTPVWNEAGDLEGSRQATKRRGAVLHAAGSSAALHSLTQKTVNKRGHSGLGPHWEEAQTHDNCLWEAGLENSKSTVWYKVIAGFHTEVDSENAPHQSTKMDHNGDSSSGTDEIRFGLFWFDVLCWTMQEHGVHFRKIPKVKIV